MDALTAHNGSPGRLADYRRQSERTTRTVGEDPAIFATALETLAVKAFGDMGQTGRLHSIRDRFIAGHISCELRRHLDSVPPETPIRDVVDRCRVWESHADPAVRRVSKPSPDPIYPAYVVGDADKISETTRVAAVTRQKSGSDQLEDLLRRLLMAVDTPAPAVPAVEKLLQRLVGETQSRPPPVVSSPVPTELEQMLGSSSRDSANDSGHCRDSDPSDETGTEWCVSPVGSQVMQQHGARTWTNPFRLCCQDGGQRKRRGDLL